MYGYKIHEDCVHRNILMLAFSFNFLARLVACGNWQCEFDCEWRIRLRMQLILNLWQQFYSIEFARDIYSIHSSNTVSTQTNIRKGIFFRRFGTDFPHQQTKKYVCENVLHVFWYLHSVQPTQFKTIHSQSQSVGTHHEIFRYCVEKTNCSRID